MRQPVHKPGQLHEGALAECLGAVDRFGSEFVEAMGDSTRFGLAKSLVTEMLADGVDLNDRHAVQTWVDASNARPGRPKGPPPKAR